MNMPRCKTCRHWQASGNHQAEVVCGVVDRRTFERATPPFEIRVCEHPAQAHFEQPATASTFALTDAEEYFVCLATGEDFGCVLHEDLASVAGTADLTVNAPDIDDISITGARTFTRFRAPIDRAVRVTVDAAFSLANNANISTPIGATLTLPAGECLLIELMPHADPERLAELQAIADEPVVVGILRCDLSKSLFDNGSGESEAETKKPL